jgi:transposase
LLGLRAYPWAKTAKENEMAKKYVVHLTDAERATLLQMLAAGKVAARTLAHAHILLKADAADGAPGWRDQQIVEAFEVSLSTVGRVRRQVIEQGLEAALHRQAPAEPAPHKLDGEQEAHLIALAWSAPPTGRKRWTLRLLASRVVALQIAEEVSYETVRRVLKKTRSSLG